MLLQLPKLPYKASTTEMAAGACCAVSLALFGMAEALGACFWGVMMFPYVPSATNLHAVIPISIYLSIDRHSRWATGLYLLTNPVQSSPC